jgi:hypothetical protein
VRARSSSAGEPRVRRIEHAGVIGLGLGIGCLDIGNRQRGPVWRRVGCLGRGRRSGDERKAKGEVFHHGVLPDSPLPRRAPAGFRARID